MCIDGVCGVMCSNLHSVTVMSTCSVQCGGGHVCACASACVCVCVCVCASACASACVCVCVCMPMLCPNTQECLCNTESPSMSVFSEYCQTAEP